MKKRSNSGWIGVILILLVQLACNMGNLPAQYQCEMEGGIWHSPVLEEQGWCEEQPLNENEAQNPAGDEPHAPQENPPPEETEEYIPPPDAPPQECNATLYIQAQVEIIKNTQETSYRECDYKLSAINIHASEEIWIVRRTNTSIHSSATNSDDSYWYADLLMPGQSWEAQFRSTYYTDGQTSREGVDKIVGVINRPECLYLLTSPEVEAISTAVEWACAP